MSSSQTAQSRNRRMNALRKEKAAEQEVAAAAAGSGAGARGEAAGISVGGTTGRRTPVRLAPEWGPEAGRMVSPKWDLAVLAAADEELERELGSSWGAADKVECTALHVHTPTPTPTHALPPPAFPPRRLQDDSHLAPHTPPHTPR